MGRVKSAMIKKASLQLFEKSGDFSEDFAHNKKVLYGTIPYKSVRNKVAGGIVRLAKQRKLKEQKEKNTDAKSVEIEEN